MNEKGLRYIDPGWKNKVVHVFMDVEMKVHDFLLSVHIEEPAVVPVQQPLGLDEVHALTHQVREVRLCSSF